MRSRPLTVALLFLLVFTLDAVFRRRGFEDDKSLDVQVVIRLVIWVASVAYALVNFRQLFAMLKQPVTWPWLLLLLWLSATAAFSPSPLYTLVSGFSLLAVLVTVLISAARLGERGTLWVILSAIATVMVLSLAIYFAIPSFGHAYTFHLKSLVMTSRLRGIANQPNVLGQMSGAAALIGIVYYGRLAGRKALALQIIIALGIACVILAQSRTTLVAMVFGLAFYWLMQRKSRWAIPLVLVLATFFLFFAIPNAEFIASKFARSGNAEEIYTATSRVYVWQVAWHLIQMKPIIGWGYNTVPQVFPQYIPTVAPEIIAYTPPHAHDAYLQIAYSGGVIAFLLFVAGIVNTGRILIINRAWSALSILAFWMVTTLTEPGGFSGVANVTTVVTFLPVGACCLLELAAHRRRQNAQPKRPSRKSMAEKERWTISDIEAERQPDLAPEADGSA